MSVRYHTDPRATMEVLLKHGAHINAYDMNSWTALTECGHSGRRQLAEFLLANGAQVDGKPGPDDPATASNPSLEGKIQETPLVVCAEWSWNEDLICLLLDKGADVEGRNKEGRTMAQLATEAKRGVVLDKLAIMNGVGVLQSERTEFVNGKTGKDENNAIGMYSELRWFSLMNLNSSDFPLIPERFCRFVRRERWTSRIQSLHVEASTNILDIYTPNVYHSMLTNVSRLSKNKPLSTCFLSIWTAPVKRRSGPVASKLTRLTLTDVASPSAG